MPTLLAAAILLPLIPGVGLAYWAGRSNSAGRRRLAAWTAAAFALAVLAILLTLAPAVFDGQVLLTHVPWVPGLGLDIGLRLDGLALLFAMLISAIGVLIVLYAAYYLGPDDPAGKFYGLLMLFMAAMLGVALSDNLLLLVVFWELTSLSSFLLVGYWGHRAEARAGARVALAVTGGGGVVMLAGIVLLGQIGGSYDLSTLLTRGDIVRADPLYPLVLGLILFGCFTKSAQLPFHFWLPEAMAAPTPVSAYLHSATMVKAGVFLVARLYPVLGQTGLFESVVCSVGLATMVFAAYVAIFKHDLKGLLAYSTISHLGLIMFLLGLDSPLSAPAAMFHLLNHATFKASLFMTAGIIEHETGTRDMRRLNGLFRFMPWTATLAMVAAASMAGVPLVNGFLSKEMFFGEALEAAGPLVGLLPVLAVLGALFSVAYSARFIHNVFFNGDPVDLPNPHPHEPPRFMKAPVAILVALCVVVGIFPAQTFGPLVLLASTAVLGHAPPPYQLALWHGFNLPLVMSMVALVGGVSLYLLLLRRFDLHLHCPRGYSGRQIFTHAIDGLFGFARRVTQWQGGGSLQRNVAWLVGAAVVIGAAPFVGAGAAPLGGSRPGLAAGPLAIVLWLLLLLAGGALVLRQRDRYESVVLAGVVGLVTVLTFAAFSAPDLALTQLCVEVVSTVLLLMGLALLPAASPRESSAARRGRDGLLALAGGTGVAWLAWLVMTRDHDSISWFFARESLPAGGGGNIVNVILVDFRGYDTFGEITVLAIAAVGVLALLDGLRVRRPRADAAGRAWSFAAPPPMLRVAARLMLPFSLVLSAYIFWRGHNLPGGGFIAGLITAVGLVMQAMARGEADVERRVHGHLEQRLARGLALGLGLAGLTGVGAFLFGRPFLTSAHGHPMLPLLGELPLASAALFDLGVYCTVVSATLMTLSVLANASKEVPRSRPTPLLRPQPGGSPGSQPLPTGARPA